MGNPDGFDHTTATGAVLALNRPISESQELYAQPMIQTDSAISPGSAGGPLVNLQGDHAVDPPPIPRARTAAARSRHAAALLLIWAVLVLVGCGARLPVDGSAFQMRRPPNRPSPVATAGPTRAPPASATPLPNSTPARPSPEPAATPPAPPIVYLDPGHGGVDSGTIGIADDGTVVEEKTITLAIAVRTAAILRRAGIGVVLSRTNDSLPGTTRSNYTSDGKELTPEGVLADLQRRIDRANASGARVLLSIHLNAFDDPSIGGAETFYDGARPFSDRNRRFATLVQDTLIADLRANGYDTPDRGVTDDRNLHAGNLGALPGDYHHLVLLGPRVPGYLRASQMPGALSEPLYLSNPPEATAATQPAMQELIANAYAQAIEAFVHRGGP